jgi:3-methyl-2-oxobutanoate hydroxymethyltransferase
MVEIGIPVMGHIGLTPQSVHALGGYRVQGKSASARESIIQDAIALEDAGVYSIVLEGIPLELAQAITDRVKVPTIGIGAGPHCDGQILVLQDFLGLNTDFQPKFVKQFARLAEQTRAAVSTYATEVRQKSFPEKEHSFHVNT